MKESHANAIEHKRQKISEYQFFIKFEKLIHVNFKTLSCCNIIQEFSTTLRNDYSLNPKTPDQDFFK